MTDLKVKGIEEGSGAVVLEWGSQGTEMSIRLPRDAAYRLLGRLESALAESIPPTAVYRMRRA